MCMCLARGGVGGVGVIGFGRYQSWRNRGKLDISFGYGGVGGRLGPGSGRVQYC